MKNVLEEKQTMNSLVNWEIIGYGIVLKVK